MRVKDVERLTGLSTKAIRLYEEEGLISVERLSCELVEESGQGL
ncbi:TPA: MerR family DNA-binding transcriptional regulator [Streptococcus suis]